MTRLAAALALLALAAPVHARPVAGVDFPDSIDVAGQKLVLNGAGLRKRFVVKVYAGGLYLATRSRDAAAIVASDAPKRVRMVFLREVERSQIMDAFREGFEKNSGGPGLKDLLAKLERVASAIPDLKRGAEMSVTYVPGQGTTVAAAGGSGEVVVEGKEFADAMFRNWLGNAPADAGLKGAMLGE